MSKPVAGQWYEWQGSRVYCVGQDSHGHTIVNHECGTLNILRGKLIEELTHLPDCTGWDWEPETFPQYWTTLETGGQAAFIKLISESQWVCVRKDGSETQRNSYVLREMLLRDRTRLTEAEALALLDKPQQPAEDAEEWVEITDPEHVLRECDWLNVIVDNCPFTEAGWTQCNSTVGSKVAQGYGCVFRCRRKDLPAKKRRTVTVPKWIITCKRNGQRTIKHQDNVTGYAADIYTVERIGETTYTEENGSWTES